ncbi:MAG: hypothetical protein IJT21_11215, partial [Synergistaceae bacterium]|nr:hypothetical protein [Synergistaceae bacterium]
PPPPPPHADQTINGKAIGSVDDVVREVNGGELSIPKKGLITLRGGDFNSNTYIDVFASTFGADAAASNARKIFTTYPDSTKAITTYTEVPKLVFFPVSKLRVPDYLGEPTPLRPAVSRKLYNGKRALMFHNLALNGEFKYYFKTLSNTRSAATTGITPDNLVNLVNISDFGTYTSPAFSNAEKCIRQIYGANVMSVKGYDREIFIAANGVVRSKQNIIRKFFMNNVYYTFDSQNEVRLEFFALSADNQGTMTQEPLTSLTHETPYRGQPYFISTVVGDFDGDKYDNEVALIINTRTEIRLFVYRLNYSNGKLTLGSLGDANGIQVYTSDRWSDYLDEQPVTDIAAGDFDGDGKKEIAILYKRPRLATALKNDKGWSMGPTVGDVNCVVYQWNAGKMGFDSVETSKEYSGEKLKDAWYDDLPEAWATTVVGLRATAADLDGDGKDEIATVLLGYYHHKQWDAKIKFYKLRRDDAYVYPHLTVWTFNRNSIKPIHDDSHVKGGVDSGENRYDFGPLYELVKNQTKLLGDKPFLEYRRIWYNKLYTSRNKNEGTNPNNIKYMYAPRELSIAAGPFTGKIGTFKTIDDIAISWRDKDGNDCVTIFKTKLNANKQFDGFEDGKLAVKDKSSASSAGQETWRGLVAVDIASEGVELDKPTHIKTKTARNYIAVLNAIPYHVDTVSTDGKTLSTQPVNFTFSDGGDGNMKVSYGKSTVDSTTNTVKQDLSQTVETMLAIDPKADGKVWGKVQGIAMLASAVSDIATGIKSGGMTPKDMFEQGIPESPLGWLNDAVGFFTDKIETIDQRTNSNTTTTTIDKNIIATTHDAILYTDTARHIWRYPVMTRPLPMWMTLGSRVDSVTAAPTSLSGDKQIFVTFTMNENSQLNTSNSASDTLYQPLHEEGNFFSYPSQIGDVEGYNDAGLLAGVNTWAFSSGTTDLTIMRFEQAEKNMQHTEKRVTPSPFTMTTSAIDRLINGDNASPVDIPNSDNPKTFTKEYSKTEGISFNLQGRSDLFAQHAAGHTVKIQPFVAKEGAMTLGTAVELTSTNNDTLWESGSIYREKTDPALLLPMKFNRVGNSFIPNTNEKSATRIRGIKFYMPDFAFLSDNRLVSGQKYEIRVPIYNASFKDTGNFNVRLSWAADNTMTAQKNIIGTTTLSLSGWSNNNNNNKGTAIFEWTPDIAPNTQTTPQYYFYVEIDYDHQLSEVHEERYSSGGTISDYGGNNTGFYPFYVSNLDNSNMTGRGTLLASIAAADEIQLNSLYFTDGDDNRINDMAAFMNTHSEDSFVTVTANFNYSGPETNYAFFAGYVLTQSGKQKIPNAGINTIVDLDNLTSEDIDNVFMINDIALYNGSNKVTFTFSPSELMASADEIIAAQDLITFGIKIITDEELQDDEESYEGEDPLFVLDEVPDDVVANPTGEIYTLSADEEVFWKIASVKFNGNTEDDLSSYLDITIDTPNEDETIPGNYGKEAYITVTSIAGYTPKGDFEITVQKSIGDDENIWTDAGVLKFTAADNDGSEEEDISVNAPSSGGGCNFGFTLFALGLALILKRK